MNSSISGHILSAIKKVPPLRKLLWKSIYENMANESLDIQGKWRFMNYGYAPLDHSRIIELDTSDEADRFSIQLYAHALQGVSIEGKEVLEVGSGRGGGCYFMSRYLSPKRLLGIDYSATQVAISNKEYAATHNLQFQTGDAERLPCKDETFDVVVNIESSHCYGNVKKFFEEVLRVLKPGGYFVFADMRFAQDAAELDALLQHSSFTLIRHQDITSNVLTALDDGNELKLATIANVVSGKQAEKLKERGGAKGSKLHSAMCNGGLVYRSALLQKR